jgi:catalase
MTTASGRPVADNQNSITVGPGGPLLMQIFISWKSSRI